MWKPTNHSRLALMRYVLYWTGSPLRNPLQQSVQQRSPQEAFRLCSWCRNHHRMSQLPPHLPSTHFLTLASEQGAANHSLFQPINFVKRLLASSLMFKVPIRRLATVNKVPLAKAAPLRRVGRKKQHAELTESVHHRNVVAYAVGEEINISNLRIEIAKQGVYEIVDLPRDIRGVLLVTARYKVEGQAREAFFFSDGGVAFWHMSESERHDLWKLARTFALNPYSHHLIIEENESLPVIYDSATRLVGDTIHLKTAPQDKQFDEETTLHKYTFSNALSQSVNLAVSEANLERFINLLEPETQKLRDGGKSRLKKKEINMKLGEVFQLRHEVNLESGYLDDPDIYWEREELEGLYRQIISYLSVPKRIKVMNERLNYVSEILQLLNGQHMDLHHVRLEWIIIILILIEVLFECLHYAEKFGFLSFKTAGNSDISTNLDWYKGIDPTRNSSYNASPYRPPWLSEPDKGKDK